MPKPDGSGRLSKKAETEEESNVYEMEDVLDFKKDGSQNKWKVKWRGYPIDQCTWEPQDNILNPGKEIYDKMALLKKAWEAANTKKKLKKPIESPTASKKRAKSDDNEPRDVEEDMPKDEGAKKRRSSRVTASRTEESELSPVSATETTEEAKAEEEGGGSVSLPPAKEQVTAAEKPAPPPDERKDDKDDDNKPGDSKPEFNRKPVVSHMREHQGEQQVCIEWSRDDHEWQSIQVARSLYSDQLLDYLLSRVRFRPCAPGRKAP